MPTYADKVDKIITAAVLTQREKLFKQWCMKSDYTERERLYAESQALNSIKAEMLKTLRKGDL